MNVSCPECSTIYRVDPAKVPERGVRARCSRCAAIFLVRSDGSPAAPAGTRDASRGATEAAASGVGGWGSEPSPGDEAEAWRGRDENAGERSEGGSDDPTAGAGPREAEASESAEADATGQVYASSEAGEPAAPSGSSRGSGLSDEFEPAPEWSGVAWDEPGAATETGEETDADLDPRSGAVPGLDVATGLERDAKAEHDAGPEARPAAGAEAEHGAGAEDRPAAGAEAEDGPAGGEAALEGPESELPADGTLAEATSPPVESGREGGEVAPGPERVGVTSPREEEASGSLEPDDALVGTGAAGGLAGEPGPAGEAALAPSPFGSTDPRARARRLARALVSDIVVYHPDRRERSLRSGTIRQEFREEIRRSWDEYVAQVGRQIARETTYFQDALNEILAGGRRFF